MGRINTNQIDTTPGGGHWAAPNSPVDDYTGWLREQYRTRRDVAQYIELIARRIAVSGATVSYDGPYAQEAQAAIEKVIGTNRG